MKSRLELIKQKKKAAKAKENNGTISFMEVLTNTIEEITEKEKEKDRIQEAEDLAKEEQELKQQEELEKLKELPVENKAVLDLKSLKLLFDRVDYHTFCLIVLIGGIGGRHLIALYKGSEKLKEYFDRAFQPVDKNGQLINDPQKEHLFRLVLDQIGIRIQPYSFVFNYQTPKNVYFDRFIGGEVWCFGSNNVGQLGLRGGQERKIPVLNQSLNNVIQISSAGDQVLCLNNKGQVIAFGQNHKGQLGLGNYNVRRIPKIIPALVNIVQVNTSHHHSLCLDNQGRVWSFGFNESGQLGLGDYDNRNIPEMIPNLNNIIQVASGRSFSICLDSDGHVWSFGDNTNAKLGKGNWGGMEPIPTVIKDFENIKQISCGEYHTLCLTIHGRVYGFGVNTNGELGYPTFTPVISEPIEIPYMMIPIIKVCAGYEYSLCIDCFGKVWAFGKNSHGQLGLSDDQRRTKEPTEFFSQQVFETIVARYPPNTKFGKVTLPTPVPNLENIVDISCGHRHTLCLDRDERVWVFGCGEFGQCGLGNIKFGQCGLGNIKFMEKTLPTIIPNLNNVIKISCAIMSSICLVRK